MSGYSRPGFCEYSRVILCVCGADTRDLGGKTFSVVYALPACLVDVSLLIVELLLFVDLVLFPFSFSFFHFPSPFSGNPRHPSVSDASLSRLS